MGQALGKQIICIFTKGGLKSFCGDSLKRRRQEETKAKSGLMGMRGEFVLLGDQTGSKVWVRQTVNSNYWTTGEEESALQSSLLPSGGQSRPYKDPAKGCASTVGSSLS